MFLFPLVTFSFMFMIMFPSGFRILFIWAATWVNHSGYSFSFIPPYWFALWFAYGGEVTIKSILFSGICGIICKQSPCKTWFSNFCSILIILQIGSRKCCLMWGLPGICIILLLGFRSSLLFFLHRPLLGIIVLLLWGLV